MAASGSPVTLQHVDPLTLVPTGSKLPLTVSAETGWEWARHGNLLALGPHATVRNRSWVRIVDADRLRVLRTIPMRGRDVCDLAFDGPTLVVLTSKPWCFGSAGSYSLLRIDVASGHAGRATPVPGLRALVYPFTIASGDGRSFVARAGGEVDVVDLRTGAVTPHRPRRTLAKGEGFVRARWLGRHRLGLNGTIVDVRTWRRHTLMAGARGVTSGPYELVAWGAHGVNVYDQAMHFRIHVLGDEDVDDVHVVGRMLYATVGAATDIVELTTGKRIGLVPNVYFRSLLLS
jgi:hypothetical protein